MNEHKNFPKTRSFTSSPPEHFIKIWEFLTEYRRKNEVSPAMQDFVDNGLASSTSVVDFYIRHMLKYNMVKKSPVAKRRGILPVAMDQWINPNHSEDKDK